MRGEQPVGLAVEQGPEPAVVRPVVAPATAPTARSLPAAPPTPLSPALVVEQVPDDEPARRAPRR
ncbi:hypothetical protein [Cellulosimicrobium sp. Marseille-Q8652]